MNIPRVRFSWEVNLGAVLQIGAVVGCALTIYGVGLRFQWDTEKGLREAEAARAKYIPMLENAVKTNDTQDFRLEAMSNSLAEQRTLNMDNTKKLGEIATDVAVIKNEIVSNKAH